MALDEAIATEVRRGASPPVLRLYGWDRTSLTSAVFRRHRTSISNTAGFMIFRLSEGPLEEGRYSTGMN